MIAPPVAPLITSAADALAVTLNETGRVDLDHLAELLERDPDAALAELGTAVFRNPETTQWETADAYLSGSVRTKLAVAEAAAALDPQYERNVAALRAVQPKDISPSDITARLGAPWIPTDVIEAFAREVMGAEVRIWHTVEIGDLDRRGRGLRGHGRRHLRMGHLAPACRLAAARRAQQRHAADLRHRGRGRRRAARSQRRGDRGRQGEAGSRSRPPSPHGSGPIRIAPTGSRASTTTGSTTSCRGISMAAT